MSQAPISAHDATHLAAQAVAGYVPPIPMAANSSVDLSAPAGLGLPMVSSSSHSLSSASPKEQQYLWTMSADDIREWLHGTHPLFPKLKIPKAAEPNAHTDDYGKCSEMK